MGQELNTQDYTKHKTDFYRVFERFFGAKGRKMDTKILDGYWHALGNYPIDMLAKALDSLVLEDNNFMPDAGAIITEIRHIRERDSRPTTGIPVWCEHCFGTGMVQIEKIHDTRSYNTAYRCICDNGRHVDMRVKQVDPQLLEDKCLSLPKLPLATLQVLQDTPRDHVWDKGVDVAKICDDCKRPYTVRHARRVSCGELQDTHILKRTRPHQCEPCFIEEGRRVGLWR